MPKTREILIVAALCLGTGAMAQTTGGGHSGHSEGSGDMASPHAAAPAAGALPLLIPAGSGLAPPATAAVVRLLEASLARCAAVPLDWRTDCLARQIEEVAGRLPATGDYAAVRGALMQGARRLDALVAANRDPDRPVLSATGQRSGIRKIYRPVRASARARVAAAATGILTETQTVLLRSAGNSQERRSHYQRVAAALNSGKVLLRS